MDIRERKLDNKDSGVERMMKDLRIKEYEIDSKNAKIQELKSEIDERVCCAREDHDREWKVWCVCVSDIMCLGMLYLRSMTVCSEWIREGMSRDMRCVVFGC